MPCQVCELACRVHRHRCAHDQHRRVAHCEPDRCKILARIVRQVAAQRRIDRNRTYGREQQGRAVGLRARNVFGCNCAVCAGPVSTTTL
jgi:hypothetical protein